MFCKIYEFTICSAYLPWQATAWYGTPADFTQKYREKQIHIIAIFVKLIEIIYMYLKTIWIQCKITKGYGYGKVCFHLYSTLLIPVQVAGSRSLLAG